jgi:hypothetical protein
MNERVLDELVGIWEYWTDGDPLLRRAVQSRGAGSGSHHASQDAVLERLTLLAHCDNPNAATCATLNAGWAVLLALGHESYTHSKPWQRLRREALDAHQEAFTDQQPTKKQAPAAER